MKRQMYGIRLLVASLAALALTGPARAGAQVPFKGAFTGFATPKAVDPCTYPVPISGAGQATHLGRFTWESTIVVTDLCTLFPGFNFHDDSVTLTAANGDQLFGTGVGTGSLVDFTDPGKIRVLSYMTLTITGGTGRFVNSTGIIRESLVSKIYARTFLPDGSPADPVVATLEGTLSSVGSDKQ
jgi:hypothetical protein